MDKKKMLIIAAAVVIVAAVVIMIRSTPQQRIQRGAAEWEYLYRCRACEAIYPTDTATLNTLIRQGRTAEPEDDYRLFECEVCGEIEAILHHEIPRELQ